jgi:hypothetical protein
MLAGDLPARSYARRHAAMAPPNSQDLSKFASDAFYVTVGLGVIAVQKAQVQRKEVQKELGKRMENRVKTFEERWQALVSHRAA